MSAQTETSQSGVLDIIKLLIAAAALVGGLYAYYYYETEIAQAVRVLMVLGGTIAGYRHCNDKRPGTTSLALHSGFARRDSQSCMADKAGNDAKQRLLSSFLH